MAEPNEPTEDADSFVELLVDATDYGKRITYRTGLVSYVEELKDGRLIGRGWNASGSPTLPGSLYDPAEQPAPEAFAIDIDGYSLRAGWRLIDIDRIESDSALHIVIRLHNEHRPVDLEVHTLLDGTAVITRWLQITNLSDNAAAISRADTWTGVLWHRHSWELYGGADDPVDFSLGHFTDTRWGHEGSFDWTDLPPLSVELAGHYRRPPYRHPFFILRAHQTGEHFIGQLAWSGGWTFGFDHELHPGRPSRGQDRPQQVSFRAGPDAPAPQLILVSNETCNTPRMHLGLVTGDLDAAVNAMHDHTRRSVLRRDPARFGLIESAIGPELELNHERVLHELEEAAAIGADVFFIDASWYTPPGGDWFATAGRWKLDPDRFPYGLSPIRERAHQLGMKFGLWMEPERIGAAAEAAGSDAMLGRRIDGKPFRGQLDLSRQDTVQWIEDQISALIVDNEVDFFRLDYNVLYVGAGFVSQDDHRAGETHFWRYYDNFYALFDRLRVRFPDVIFENCAGGGSRTDLGIVQRFDHTWVTDWQLPPRSFEISNGMTMALPPEYIDRLIGVGLNSLVRGSLDFGLHNALFGRPTIAHLHPIGSRRSAEQVRRLKSFIDVYKDVVRPKQSSVRVYHHTPTASEQHKGGWGVLEQAAADHSVSIIGAFRLNNNGSGHIVIHPRGIDAGSTYSVRLESTGECTTISGFTLQSMGIRVERPAALTSELLIIQEASDKR